VREWKSGWACSTARLGRRGSPRGSKASRTVGPEALRLLRDGEERAKEAAPSVLCSSWFHTDPSRTRSIDSPRAKGQPNLGTRASMLFGAAGVLGWSEEIGFFREAGLFEPFSSDRGRWPLGRWPRTRESHRASGASGRWVPIQKPRALDARPPRFLGFEGFSDRTSSGARSENVGAAGSWLEALPVSGDGFGGLRIDEAGRAETRVPRVEARKVLASSYAPRALPSCRRSALRG
jgi:hypothetical protein